MVGFLCISDISKFVENSTTINSEKWSKLLEVQQPKNPTRKSTPLFLSNAFWKRVYPSVPCLKTETNRLKVQEDYRNLPVPPFW